MNKLSDLAEVFVIASAVLVVLVGIGIGATILISVWYVNSMDHYQDRDAGLGLCCMGFSFSTLVTPFVVFAVYRFFERRFRVSKKEPPTQP